MKHLLPILLLLLAACSFDVAAQSLSAPSKVLMHRRHASHAVGARDARPVQAFVEIADASSLDSLRQSGVRVMGHWGNVAIVEMPFEVVREVSALPMVRRMSLAQPMQLCNDSAMAAVNVATAWDGLELDRAYRGKDVIVGVIDTGIDFHHINFRDAMGRSRVERVYLPADSIGRHPVIDGDTLSGSEWTTAEEIVALTADNTASSHGTHTTGTAAGSYTANGLAGVAQESRLVLCAMPEDQLTDVAIANSVRYIFNYARSIGRPAVVNMSLADNTGPHDGTSYLCALFDSLAGPGRVIVLSAGNDGDKPVHIARHVAAGDTVRTLLRNRYGGSSLAGNVTSWSTTDYAIRFVVMDMNKRQIVYRSPLFANLPADSVVEINSENDPEFARYHAGIIQYAIEHDSIRDRYQSICVMSTKSTDNNYIIGLEYHVESAADFNLWSNGYTFMLSMGLDDWIQGTPDGSISDMATGHNTITVGSFDTRRYTPAWQSETPNLYADSHPPAVSGFSSYGPDMNGISRPDILAPGQAVVSSVSRYDTESAAAHRSLATVETVGGTDYPYGVYSGTSMSAPVITGAIALWLQVDSALTAADIRDVFKATSLRDNYVIAGNPEKVGLGKVDITAGLRYLIKRRADVDGDGVLNVTDVTAVINVILGIESEAAFGGRADVNRDGVVNTSDVTELIRILLW